MQFINMLEKVEFQRDGKVTTLVIDVEKSVGDERLFTKASKEGTDFIITSNSAFKGDEVKIELGVDEALLDTAENPLLWVLSNDFKIPKIGSARFKFMQVSEGIYLTALVRGTIGYEFGGDTHGVARCGTNSSEYIPLPDNFLSNLEVIAKTALYPLKDSILDVVITSKPDGVKFKLNKEYSVCLAEKLKSKKKITLPANQRVRVSTLVTNYKEGVKTNTHKIQGGLCDIIDRISLKAEQIDCEDVLKDSYIYTACVVSLWSFKMLNKVLDGYRTRLMSIIADEDYVNDLLGYNSELFQGRYRKGDFFYVAGAISRVKGSIHGIEDICLNDGTLSIPEVVFKSRDDYARLLLSGSEVVELENLLKLDDCDLPKYGDQIEFSNGDNIPYSVYFLSSSDEAIDEWVSMYSKKKKKSKPKKSDQTITLSHSEGISVFADFLERAKKSDDVGEGSKVH